MKNKFYNLNVFSEPMKVGLIKEEYANNKRNLEIEVI